MKKIAILFPGQGAQFKGMGKDVFPLFPELTELASDILGYSVERLCVSDPEGKLRYTDYTQPALYVVNALNYYNLKNERPELGDAHFLMGHSLGEYNALLAADVFDFETGLRLVQKRGELMARAREGGMAAILGARIEQVRHIMSDHHLDEIDIANLNTPTQAIIAGPKESMVAAEKAFDSSGFTYYPLNVSAPFHSRYMEDAQAVFVRFAAQFAFRSPKSAVIANYTARPYENNAIEATLIKQIANCVRWVESVRYVMDQGDVEFIEVGSTILTKMVKEVGSERNLASVGLS
ncbi:ACP S-malonyltransferase [Chromobacterium piscinae]|uniref:ACP S-malonyltransferase n=1 Tax=Chromobacterium piscinae TaxID=686831 RepID=UPI001E61000E|nr:ACP S-malonyltransferase [Chromobacterium piscinae]MCD4505236.1 ACP S-malonyltransferase [Chromobacterium piscinae]